MNPSLPTIQRGAQTARHLLLIGVCLAAFCAQLANADSLVALGEVNADGTLEFGHAESEATVTSVRDDTGDYSITIARPGLFVGAQAFDFIVELTPILAGGASDEVFRSHGGFTVSDDEVTIRVHSTDVEEDGATTGTPRNSPFYFVIRRIPVYESLDSETRFLKAHGVYRTTFPSDSRITAPGLDIEVLPEVSGVGSVEIRLTGQEIRASDRIVVQASVRSSSHGDEIVHVNCYVSDNLAVATIYTLDVNTPSNYQEQVNSDFSFSIYLIPDSPAEGIRTEFLQAIGRVGPSGIFTKAATIEGLSFSNTLQLGTGHYFFQILGSPGNLFDVNGSNEYTLIVTPEGFGNLDEAIRGWVDVVSETYMVVHVFIDDVEDTTEQGTPNNAPFHFAVYHSGPTAVSNPKPETGISSLAKAVLLKKIKKLKKKAKSAKRKKQVAKAKKLKKQIQKLKKQLRAL